MRAPPYTQGRQGGLAHGSVRSAMSISGTPAAPVSSGASKVLDFVGPEVTSRSPYAEAYAGTAAMPRVLRFVPVSSSSTTKWPGRPPLGHNGRFYQSARLGLP